MAQSVCRPRGGFSDLQEDSAIAVEPVQEMARKHSSEMVQKWFCFRQDAWVLATYTPGNSRAKALVERILSSAKSLHQQKEGEHHACSCHTGSLQGTSTR